MTERPNNDPLGLGVIGDIAERLNALHDGELNNPKGRRAKFLIEQLKNAHNDALTKMELLKDRYTLLKRTNAALCDELDWLRDQVDDLSSR